MKKLFVFIAFSFILTIPVIHAQTEKGTLLLGGMAGMDYRFTKGNSGFYISLDPNIGFFAADNIAIGARFRLGFFTTDDYYMINYGIQPFIRYYFLKREKSAFFVPLDFGIVGAYMKSNNSDSHDSYYSLGGDLGFGFVYFLNKSIGLETILNYEFFKYEDEPLQSDLSLMVGLQIFFQKRK